MTTEKINKLPLILKGMAMGISEVIPGVSGGTIAFITGIYERLINAIKSFGPEVFKSFKSSGIKGVWETIDGNFLSFLMIGMISGIGISVFGIHFLIEHYPAPLWAFFFGLILASSIFIGRQITKWSLLNIALALIAAVSIYYVTTIAPSTGSLHPLMLFGSGFIAITAFVLPGISGSFILLLLGMYTIVIPLLKEFISSPSFDEFKPLFIFGLGCLLGLAVFSRVLSWTFKHYRNQTFAILTGIMIGSLNKIWPWKNPKQLLLKEDMSMHYDNLTAIINSGKEFKVIKDLNVMPADYLNGNPHLTLVIICFILGIVGVGLLAMFSHTTD